MKILIIEDEQSSADRLRRMLESEPMEQREQSDACISSAESRQRKTEGQHEIVGVCASNAAENGRYPPTQNGDIRSLFLLFILMAVQN